MSDEAWRETVKREASSSDATLLRAGDAVGRFRLDTLLGRGGMGEVWKAFDPELKRPVAIKFLLGASPDDQKRFQQEAQVVAGLGHPNIAPVFEAGTHEGRGYFVMRFLEGATLDRAGLPLPELLRVVKSAAEVLHHAHQKGVIHRDIKPGNLMVAAGQVYVMDFGLARRTEGVGSLSLPGHVVGTPVYMSPEQARGLPLDARTDVYSLGATLYELLSGRPPFAHSELFALLEAVATQDPPSLKGLPSELWTIVRKAMEKDRERRYPTAAALADDIDRYLTGRPILARPPAVVYRLKKHAARHPAVWTAGLIAVLASAAGAALVASGAKARAASEARLREAAELSRAALAGAKDAKALYRVKTAKPAEWDKLRREALALARRAIERGPELAGSYLTLGQILQGQQDWAEALAAYDEALKRDPRLAEAYYQRCLCRLELYQEIAAPPVRLERYAPRESPRERQKRGEPLKRAALEDLAEYRRLRGASYETSWERTFVDGVIALSEGRYREAAQAADALLTRSESDELVWFMKARSRGAQRKLDEAIAIVDALIENVMPRFSRAYHARALYKARKEDHAGARDDFATAVELDPDAWRSRFGLARERLELGEWEGAAAEYTAGMKLKGAPDAIALVGRGRAREKLGDLDGALADFAAALSLEPEALSLRYDIGRARHAKGLPAQEDFAAAAEKAPRPGREDLRDALDHWTLLIGRDPRNAWAYFQRALVRRERGDAAGATEDLTKAIEANPAFAPAWRYRGDLDKAIELHPAYAEALFERGGRREKAGDRAGAADDYAKALSSAGAELAEACRQALRRVR